MITNQDKIRTESSIGHAQGWILYLPSNLKEKQRYARAHRPALVPVCAAAMITVGIFGLIDSFLILASSIIWGWLIIGIIGLVTLASGIGLFRRTDWAYGLAANFSILNLFVGFIELIGAFNTHYAILGLVGIGQAVGVGTFVLSALALCILTRKEVKQYYWGFA